MLLAYVQLMAGDGGASDLAAKREQREGQSIAKLMEVVVGANFLAAQKVLMVVLITALHTAVVDAAAIQLVFVLQGENLDCASGTAVAKGVRGTIAQRAQKVLQASAFPMEVEGAATLRIVQKVLRVAHCFVRLMVVARGAHFRDAQKELRGALSFVRDMAEGSVAHIRRVEKFAQRACMGEPHFV